MSDPRLISIWNGNAFYVKTYEDGDGYYYAIVHSPDFATKDEALRFTNGIINFTRKWPNA